MALLDQWEIALEDKTKELQKCQQTKNLKSCLGCKEVNECKLRDAYVKAVYDSMSKGAGGGFEF
ncbi:MAG: hypothetical protein U9R27_11470 [Campylobacterota bacterium]|nr:hypothetical protein [Campylobacterota bacterium]